MADALARNGMEDITSETDNLYRTVKFTFPSPYYGRMHGLAEVRAGSGNARFRILGGNMSNSDIYVIGGNTEFLGLVHYYDFGFDIPKDLIFAADPAGGLDGLEGFMKIVTGICSYYR
jgi:hypothetical protein